MAIPTHIFDLETANANFGVVGRASVESFLGLNKGQFKASSMYRTHIKNPLLQVYASGLTKDKGWIKPNVAEFAIPKVSAGRYKISNFSKPIFAKAMEHGTMSEAERVREFYLGLEQSIAIHGSANLTGWNIAFDLPAMEAATYRIPGLEKWQGWLATQHGINKLDSSKGLHISSGEEVFAQAALSYAKTDPIFHAAHLNKAGSVEDVLAIQGWSLENVAKAWGKTVDAHNAASDAQFTAEVIGAAKSGEFGGDFWRTVFTQSAAKAAAGKAKMPSKAAQVMVEGLKAAKTGGPLGKYGAAYVAGGIVAAGAISIAMAYSRREDRQTHITGLSDAGIAVHTRHQLTSFGSGWKGLEPIEPYPDYNRTLRTAGILGVGGALYAGHSFMLRNTPHYASSMYKAALAFEDIVPGHIGTTFGLSERASSYVIKDLYFSREQLISNGQFTKMGEHFQRILGDHVDLNKLGTEGLHFRRTERGSPFLNLKGHENIRVRFSPTGKRFAGSSFRYQRPLEQHDIPWPTDWSSFGAAKKSVNDWRRSQDPFAYNYHTGARDAASGAKAPRFAPWYANVAPAAGASRAEKATSWFGNVRRAVEPQAFELFERPLRLLSEVGIGGLFQGSYNKVFHIPFVGEGGLLNALLFKRVLPVAVGLGAAGYLDYKTGHVVSNTLRSVPARANLLRADLTDMIPGARRVTDWYKQEEGDLPQYAPLALPMGGMFAGSLLFHINKLAGKYEVSSRLASARMQRIQSSLIPGRYKSALRVMGREEGIGNKLKVAWSAFGLPGKGALIGLAAMLPFLPGMLGSRKTGSEERRIYSGEQEVPVRQGRWWEVGETPFAGTRITAWRPHASVLAESHARAKSLYGSEENAWAHSPILHPLRWLKDPYYLEKLHYKDRPYPITSPAFSNVPIIGPLLAASIGKVFKPVKRMHEEEWSEDTDYTLYSSRLEPRGPKVESKLERDVMFNMASHGYKVDTQVKAGKYRLDFVVSAGDGRAVAIEADGITFHHTPRQKRHDMERQAELVKQGWDMVRVSSPKFWLDPDAAMAPIYSHLQSRGLYPGSDLDGMDIYSGLYGYAPSQPVEEFTPWHVAKQMWANVTEFIGLPGWLMSIAGKRAYPKRQKKDVYFQGSRQMTSTARGYYEKNLGAGMAPSISGEFQGHTEPLRRFIQPGIDRFTPQVNEIPNQMPSWMPGEDYLVNFRKGDPYVKVDEGFARLPGAGYTALHPELEGINPEDYPAMTKMKILADVAPYSREYQKQAALTRHQVGDDPERLAEYERIADQVRQTKESTLQVAKRHFTAPVDTIEGTVKRVSAEGVELSEYPGQTFHFSSVGGSMADLTAQILGEHNRMTKAQAAQEASRQIDNRAAYLSSALAEGTHIKAVVPRGAAGSEQDIQAVISADGDNINRELIHRGYGVFRTDMGGAEQQAMHGRFAKAFGKYSEGLFFQGDLGVLNPMRYLPTPFHTKLAQERTALSQYIQQESVGTRMRRWDRPLHDFLGSYLRGTIDRLTGIKVIPKDVQYRRDLDTTTDMLGYLRGLHLAAQEPGNRGAHLAQAKRTITGGNLFGDPGYVASMLPSREARYFRQFVGESDPKEREKILAIVPNQVSEALQAQWVKKEAMIKQARTGDQIDLGSQGKLYTKDDLNEYKRAKTKLQIGDYLRSRQIAKFFFTKKLHLPDEPDSTALASNLDYQDVKLKLVQLQGYDEHDFNLFDDRSDTLWRKPYVDGAVRELTSGDTRSQDQIRQAVEQMMLAAGTSNPDVRYTARKAHRSRANVTVHAQEDDEKELLTDIRRGKEAA